MKDKTTHFGFSKVAWEEKAKKVAGVFNSVAGQYDIMNDVMSFGLHRLWKRFTIDLAGVKSGESILDVAAGTGDLTAFFSEIVGKGGLVISSDINYAMLSRGRDRLLDKGLVQNIAFAQANAECLPFPDNYFNCITIGFGLRNVTDKAKALESMHRILKPGGRLLILEFSKPQSELLQKVYDVYSFKCLPLFGKLIAKDADSYQYLAESIRMHPDQETLKNMMETAQFTHCDYHNLCGGIVAVHRGFKC